MKNFLYPQPPPVFIGRNSEIETLEKGIERFRLFLIAGFPGIGKTSLASFFLQKNFKDSKKPIIWINCDKDTDIESLILRSLASLNFDTNDYILNSKSFFDEYLSLGKSKSGNENEEIKTNKTLKFILFLNKLNAILVMDNFEMMNGADAELLIPLLHDYLSEAKAIIVSREMPKACLSAMPDIITVIPDLPNKNDCSLIIKNFTETMNLSNISFEPIKSEIIKAFGHPWLIKNFIGNQQYSGHGRPFCIKSLFNDYFQKSILNSLNKENIEIIEILSILRKPADEECLKFILEKENLDSSLDVLSRKFIIQVNSFGQYAINDLIRNSMLDSLSAARSEFLNRRCALHYGSLIRKEKEILVNFEYTKENQFYRIFLNRKEESYHYIECGDIDQATEILVGITNNFFHWLQVDEMESISDKIFKKTAKSKPEIMFLKAKYYYLKGMHDESKKILNLMNTETSHVDQIAKYSLLSKIHHQKEDFETAKKYAVEAIRLAKKCGDNYAMVNQLVLLAFASKNKVKILKSCIKMLNPSRDRLLKAEILYYLGIHYSNNFEKYKSRDLLEESLEILNSLEISKVHIAVFILLGHVYASLGEKEKGLELAQKGLSLAKKIGNAYMEAVATENIGKVYFAIGKKSEAKNTLARLMKVAQKNGYIKQCFNIKMTLAVFYEASEQYEESEKIIKELISFQKPICFPRTEALLHINLAKNYLSLNRIRESIDECKSGLEISETLGDKNLIYLSLLFLSESYYRLNDSENIDFYASRMADLAGEVSEDIVIYAKYLFAIIEDEKWTDKDKSKREIINEIRKRPFNLLGDFGVNFKRLQKLDSEKHKYTFIDKDRLWHDSSYNDEISKKIKYDFIFNRITGEIIERELGQRSIKRKKQISSLLSFLIKNRGIPFDAKTIFESTWEADYNEKIDSRTVIVSIYRLRKIIEPDSANPKYIKTCKSDGKDDYMWFFNKDTNFLYIGE